MVLGFRVSVALGVRVRARVRVRVGYRDRGWAIFRDWIGLGFGVRL